LIWIDFGYPCSEKSKIINDEILYSIIIIDIFVYFIFLKKNFIIFKEFMPIKLYQI